MARKLLINAQKPEEVRVAIVAGDHLEAYQIEVAEGGAKRGNIYRGVITNVQPSLNAAFVDFGDAKHGFLSMGDIVDEAFTKKPKTGRSRIENVLEKGKPILVQVAKDMEGKKGSGLTTNISLAGRYLVFTPYDDKRGVSRKVEDEELRKKLRDIGDSLTVPAGGGLILRTNASGQTKTTIDRDFKAVARIWRGVKADYKKTKEVGILHNDQEIVVRAMRDYVDASITEILVDTDDAFETAKEYIRVSMPRAKTKLIRYEDREPLFSRFNLESQIDAIYDRKVGLRSGGSIVIDRTEALTAVDVNSGRSTKAATQEDTAVNTNVQAAHEIARQLRLRDVGGLIVVDFIDMKSRKNRTKVEKDLKEAMKVDRARHSIGRISENGLVEINRQRIRKELHLQTHRPCPTCTGTGHIASVEMVGLTLLRRIEARAATSNLETVRIELHPELADAVQNGRRHQIAELEQEFGIRVDVIASNRLHRPDQVIEWTNAVETRESEVTTSTQQHKGGSENGSPVAGESDAPSKSKRRRRRRKKSGNGDGAGHLESEAAEHTETPDEEAVAVDAVVEPSEAPRSKRPRRRRKRSSDATKVDVARVDETTSATETEESSVTVETPDGEIAAVEAVVEPSEAPRSKRPRRRRKRSSDATKVDVAHVDETTPATETEESSVTVETAAPEEQPKKRRRRRSSSRKKPAGDQDVTGSDAPIEMTAAAAEQAPEQAPPTKPRRPSRAKKKVEVDVESTATVQSENWIVDPDKAAEGAPARKRRPRRRPRRKPTEDSTEAPAGVSSATDES